MNQMNLVYQVRRKRKTVNITTKQTKEECAGTITNFDIHLTTKMLHADIAASDYRKGSLGDLHATRVLSLSHPFAQLILIILLLKRPGILIDSVTKMLRNNGATKNVQLKGFQLKRRSIS